MDEKSVFFRSFCSSRLINVASFFKKNSLTFQPVRKPQRGRVDNIKRAQRNIGNFEVNHDSNSKVSLTTCSGPVAPQRE